LSAEHPRPLLRRDGWIDLDGSWDFALDRDAKWRRPADVVWDACIQVPFAPETPASGVACEGFCSAFWYRRRVELPQPAAGERWLLHFGAVDHVATVWIDGVPVARHEGGYTPFAVDLAAILPEGGAFDLAVRAFDDPLDLAKPRGKQEWRSEPHSIFYPRTSGIWRSVWAERVPFASIADVIWSADFERFEIGLDVAFDGLDAGAWCLRVGVRASDRALVDDVYAVERGRVARRIALPDGFDERNELAWSPEWPRLLDTTLTLERAGGSVGDRVETYTAMRSVGCERGRFTLNGRPYFLRLVLDQGYWEASGATPPDADALRRDVELAKRLGFNGVRKHQKTEDPRWLAHADRLGLLVFTELPAAQAFSPVAVRRGLAEWSEIVRAHRAHPCVAGWIPLNESWGVQGIAERAEVRAYADALVATARALDGTRPIAGNDGWEILGGDLVCIHDYDQDAAALAARYRDDASIAAHVAGWAPMGGPQYRKRMLLDPPAVADRPVLVSEFGGVGLSDDPKAWGYSMAHDPDELLRRYAALCRALVGSESLSGFCYTQLTDTYQERNGLARMDRSTKAPQQLLGLATAGLYDPGRASASTQPLTEKQPT
jgi:beta-galactosidase/beta-glucuronidase